MENAPQQTFSFTKSLITLLFVLGGLGVLGFLWKVLGYYQDFRSGELIPIGSYQATKATTARLASLAAAGEGSGTLATDDDAQFGSKDAEVTIVAFMDFGCPYSQQESYVLEGVAHNANENVRIILRDFPLTDIHPGADKAAMAAECAAEQEKYGEMYRILNASSGEFTNESLLQNAESAGLNIQEYTRCMTSGFYEQEVQEDIADGIAAGVTSTPTLFINGVKIEGAVPYSILYGAIETLAQ